MEGLNNKNNGVEKFEKEMTFDEIVDKISETKTLMKYLQKFPQYAKEAKDLELLLENLREKMSITLN
jgi:hypothetical protein